MTTYCNIECQENTVDCKNMCSNTEPGHTVHNCGQHRPAHPWGDWSDWNDFDDWRDFDDRPPFDDY